MNQPAVATRLELIEPETTSHALATKPEHAIALPQNSPASMMLAAMAQGASLEQVEKMMDLQDRWERREAEKAYSAAFAAFTSEKVTVTKRKQVSFTTRDGDTTSYKHAELADLTDAVDPALGRHGFSYSWKTRQDKEGITVTCVLKHALGHCEEVHLTAPPDASGKKNAIQQIASTVTYLERHTLKLITGVAEKGDDNDGGEHREEDADPALDGFRAAAMLGDKALRAHYDANVPSEAFWQANSKSLKAAAKKADLERAQ